MEDQYADDEQELSYQLESHEIGFVDPHLVAGVALSILRIVVMNVEKEDIMQETVKNMVGVLQGTPEAKVVAVHHVESHTAGQDLGPALAEEEDPVLETAQGPHQEGEVSREIEVPLGAVQGRGKDLALTTTGHEVIQGHLEKMAANKYFFSFLFFE